MWLTGRCGHGSLARAQVPLAWPPAAALCFRALQSQVSKRLAKGPSPRRETYRSLHLLKSSYGSDCLNVAFIQGVL